MLTGPELLAKVKELGEASKSDLVRATGYVSTKEDGSERLNFTAFYEALLEARGIHLGPARGDGAPGRKLSYVTHVLFNGNLLCQATSKTEPRFASINCYHFCLSPGNTGIPPPGAWYPACGRMQLSPRERPAIGLLRVTAAPTASFSFPALRPQGAVSGLPPLGGPGLGPRPGAGRPNATDRSGALRFAAHPLRLDFIALRFTAACHLRLDAPQPVPAQTPLQRSHLPVAVALWIMGHQALHQCP